MLIVDFEPDIGVGAMPTIHLYSVEPSTPQRTLVTSSDNLHSAIWAMYLAVGLCTETSLLLEWLDWS